MASERLEDRLLLSHFRYGNISWIPASGVDNAVDITVSESWRATAFGVTQSRVGQQVNVGALYYSDRSSASAVSVTVSSYNQAEDYFVGTTTFRKTFTAPGDVTASISGCCRISGLENNSFGYFYLDAVINVGSQNRSPVSALPPIVTVPDNALFQFQVPAVDPDGDQLTFRLAQGNEGSTGFVEPTGLSISPTGLISWDVSDSTLNTSVGDLWSAHIVVADGTSEIPLDFIFKIVLDSVTNPPPTVVADPPGPFLPRALETVNFNVVATDPNGTISSLFALNPPPGMTFGPLVITGNTASMSATFTPTESQVNQNFVVNFLATDDQGSSSTTSVTITPSLVPYNPPPVVGSNGPYVVAEGSSILLSVNAFDRQNEPMTMEWDFDYQPGSFDVDASGTNVFFSAAGLDGPSTRPVAVRVSDGTNTVTFPITVDIINTPPTITSVPSNTPVEEDQELNLSILAVDAAGVLDPLSYSFDFDNNGTFEVGPQSGNSAVHVYPLRGTYPVVVRVDDGDGGVTTQTVLIDVLPVNDPPVGIPQSLTTFEDIGLPITLTGDDSDPEVSQALTYAISTPPRFGSILGFNPATGQLTYLPDLNYYGPDSFVFTVTDDATAGGPALTSGQVTVQLSVVAQNDAPVVSGLSDTTILEDQSTGALNFSVTDVDTPLVGVSVGATSLNQALVPDGFITISGAGANRTISITPLPEQFGTAVISIVANDGLGTSTTTFVLTVLPVNDAPAFRAGANVSVRSDVGSYVLPGWATDISKGPSNEAGQSLQFQVVSNSSPGLFAAIPTIDPVTGDLRFTPRGDQFGTSTLGIRLRDNGGTGNGGVDTSLLQTVTITIAVPPIRRFEFNAAPTLQTAGYTSVRGTDTYDAITGPARTFGWKTAATEADRSSLTSSTLLRDGHYGRDNTFVAEIPNGTYTVSLMLGDKNFARDRLSLWANGTIVPGLTNLATAAGQFIHRSFTTTVSTGKLELRLQDTGGDPFWMLHALEIRPQPLVENALTLTRVNPTGTGSLDGNGVSVDTYQVTNATPGALMSVSTTAGTIATSQDQSSSFVGVQVQADAQGQVTFQVTRPTASGQLAATIVAEEVTGAKNVSLSQVYIEPNVRLFDMNYGSSPTQISPAYVGVLNTTRYSQATGFGWKSAVSGADRGLAGASDALLRDLAYGSDGTFQVKVQPGAVYTVTLRFRDTFLHDRIQVSIEGSSSPVSSDLADLTVPANTTVTRSFLAASNDGILDIRFRDLSTTGDRNWIVNAIEIVRNAGLPPVLPSPRATDAVFSTLRGI